jgi:signal transduction histidine kinase
MPKFTVDTHLFRELGELLVGRDSTALVELVKNSYDADAEVVEIHGENLGDARKGVIYVDDDGTGMSREEFENGFLRVASRLKETAGRKSSYYQRRYTGAKGVGRLAAHKLARVIEVDSQPWRRRPKPDGVYATIDWDRIERAETFDKLPDIVIDEPNEVERGTLITLSKLRKPWSKADLNRFLADVRSFQPPTILVDSLPRGFVDGDVLFRKPRLRDTSIKDPGMEIQLTGEFSIGDEYWDALITQTDWVVDVDAKATGVTYCISPTKMHRRENPDATGAVFAASHPAPSEGPFFQSRIFIREGQASSGTRIPTAWARRVAGVRVYMEGFRVLPYGDQGDDWLQLRSRYSYRGRGLPWISHLPVEAGSEVKDEGLSSPQNEQIVGGVFLTERGAPSLRMVVNREGFIPDETYYRIVNITQQAIDLSTRTRARTSIARRAARSHLRRGKKSDDGTGAGSVRELVAQQVGAVKQVAAQTEEQLARKQFAAATKSMRTLVENVERLTDVADELISERSMLLVLASLGLQMSAFVHDINAALALAGQVEGAAEELLREPDGLPRQARSQVRSFVRVIGELRRNVERQAAYLVDVVGADARRRRARQRLSRRFDDAIKIVRPRAEELGISIDNRIAPDLKSVPMFPAELVTVYLNLLTNAVKAAGKGGRVRARSRVGKDAVRVFVENTGKTVNLKTAEKWFEPFETTSASMDEVLGQGMGLGLPITRSILREYGASIAFSPPPQGFSTSLAIKFPQSRRR